MVKLWCTLIIAKRRTWTQCPLMLQAQVKEELARQGYDVNGDRL